MISKLPPSVSRSNLHELRVCLEDICMDTVLRHRMRCSSPPVSAVSAQNGSPTVLAASLVQRTCTVPRRIYGYIPTFHLHEGTTLGSMHCDMHLEEITDRATSKQARKTYSLVPMPAKTRNDTQKRETSHPVRLRHAPTPAIFLHLMTGSAETKEAMGMAITCGSQATELFGYPATGTSSCQS